MQKPEGIDIQINAKEALKPKIKNVQNNTQLRISKLDARIAKMKGRDEYLFNKVVDLMKSHDTAYSKILRQYLLVRMTNRKVINNYII